MIVKEKPRTRFLFAPIVARMGAWFVRRCHCGRLGKVAAETGRELDVYTYICSRTWMCAACANEYAEIERARDAAQFGGQP